MGAFKQLREVYPFSAKHFWLKGLHLENSTILVFPGNVPRKFSYHLLRF